MSNTQEPTSEASQPSIATNSDDSTVSFGASNEGRKKYDWESKYPDEANLIIRLEAAALALYFLLAFIGLFLTWCGSVENFVKLNFDIQHSEPLKKYAYIIFSGFLAGTIYSIKWLYHTVGKGMWHVDRQLWRFMSPLMSLAVAFVVGTLVQANLMHGNGAGLSAPSSVSLGFMAGYFSDAAIAKMYEIANVVFGTTNNSNPKK